MKYQYQHNYRVAAEKVLANLPEVFTSRQYKDLAEEVGLTKAQAEIEAGYTKALRKQYRDVYNDEYYMVHHYHCYQNRSRAGLAPEKQAALKFLDKYYKIKENVETLYWENHPITLNSLREHGFLIVDHSDTVTVKRKVTDWDKNYPRYFYKGKHVDADTYETLMKADPDNCSSSVDDTIKVKRNYYKVDWVKLNDYLNGGQDDEVAQLMLRRQELYKELEEVRKQLNGRKCNWEW